MMPLALSLTYAGLCCLCLAMNKHYAKIIGGTPPNGLPVTLRISGWSLLGLSLALCIQGRGGAFGSVIWCGLLSAAALALVLLLPYRPRLTLHLASAALLTCLLWLGVA